MDIISLMYFCLYKVYFFIVQLCAIVTRSINATYLLTYLFNLNEQTVHTKTNWRLQVAIMNCSLFSVHCSSLLCNWTLYSHLQFEKNCKSD